MLPQEIARLSPSEQIVLRAGMPPMKTGRATWFTDKTFTARVRNPPAIPRLNVSVNSTTAPRASANRISG